jgi:hypothetical protein
MIARYPLDKISSVADNTYMERTPDITEQVEEFLAPLAPFPAQPFRAIADAMDVLIEDGPALGRPLVDVINLDPDYRDLVALFGRHLKELRPLGTHVRILFTFGPDRNLVLLYAGDKAGDWKKWYPTAIREAARLYREYLEDTGQA